MQPIAITLAAIVGILVVAGAGWSAFAYKTYPKKTRWVIVFGYVLVALGGTGFFGLMFSSVGGGFGGCQQLSSGLWDSFTDL